MWVTKVESCSNQSLKDSYAYRPNADKVDNSETFKSEDETIVSDAESAYDLQANNSEYEDKLTNFEKWSNISSEKFVLNDTNSTENGIKSNEEFSNGPKGGFQEKLQIAETKLDLLASKFYEFIGNPDDVG